VVNASLFIVTFLACTGSILVYNFLFHICESIFPLLTPPPFQVIHSLFLWPAAPPTVGCVFLCTPCLTSLLTVPELNLMFLWIYFVRCPGSWFYTTCMMICFPVTHSTIPTRKWPMSVIGTNGKCTDIFYWTPYIVHIVQLSAAHIFYLWSNLDVSELSYNATLFLL
jgi:hypothetical protein